uniref:Microfibrillar-associated protein 2 isoform X1 n=1 Tax=Sus scrofa TaxID=9823 RepID=A0A480F1W1_PIG
MCGCINISDKIGQPRKAQLCCVCWCVCVCVHVLVCTRTPRLSPRAQGYLGSQSQSPRGKGGGCPPPAPPEPPRRSPGLILPATQTAARSSTRVPASIPYTSLASSVSMRSASTASAVCMLSTRRSVSAPSAPTRSSCELTYVVTSSPSAA